MTLPETPDTASGMAAGATFVCRERGTLVGVTNPQPVIGPALVEKRGEESITRPQ